MSNLCSAKTTNHSTSRGRRTRRRASREFCARSKPGAAKAATITLLPLITSSPSTAKRKTAKAPITDPVRRTGLERMAAGLRASQPGMEVRINPPGRRKVSDMIWLVAEPLLESAPDYESKEMILKLTTLAWNFTLLDPIEQEEMLAEIADLFQCPEGMDMFYYLADRKALLFPEEERVICKVETEPALYSDVAVRVASAM